MRPGNGLAVGVVLALLVGAVAIKRWAVDTVPVPPANPAPSSVATEAPWSAAPASTARIFSGASAPATAPAPPAAVWDLCGIGRLPIPAGAASQAEWPDLPAHLGSDAIDAGRDQLLAALRRGDVRARAAARYWAPMPRDGAPAERDDAGAGELLDAATQDPVVLRWAAARCRSSACQEAAAARWARIEPDNAVPRLMGMAQAPRLVGDALQALRAMRVYRTYWGSFAETARQAMPPDLPPYVQMGLLVEALGIDAAMPDGSFQLAAAMCKPPYPAGSERLAQCDALGRVMSEHGDTILAFSIGLRLREMAGLDPAEAQALRESIRKVPWSSVVAIDPAQPMSCESVVALRRWVEAVGRNGELAAVRAAIAASNPYSSTPPQSR